MIITLNGNRYHLKDGTTVKRAPLVEWPDNIRLDGQQKRKDRRFTSTWYFGDWSGGLGISKMDVDNAAHQKRIWDVECIDTRWNRLIKSPLFVTCTINPAGSMLDMPFEYSGQLYFGQAYGTMPLAYKYSTWQTLGSESIIGSGMGGSITAIHVIGNRIYTMGYNAELGGGVNLFSNILLGGSGSRLGTYVGGAVRPQMNDMGGTLHLLSHDGNRAYLYIKGDITSVSLAAVATLPSIIGTYLSPMVTDGLKMYAALPEGVYNFDDTPALIIDTKTVKDKNCQMALFDNNLYFKNSLSVLEYDGTDVLPVGYNRNDGLIKEKMGEVTAFASSNEWLFAAIKGGTYTHILTHDRTNAWQYYARVPTAGLWVSKMFFSNTPDNIDRLWIIYGNHPFPGFFTNPRINPLQAGTYSYVYSDQQGTGIFVTPEYDGGLIEEVAGFYDVFLTGQTEEYIHYASLLYGIDGRTPTQNILSTSFGTISISGKIGSPYGVSGNKIQLQLIVNSGVNDTQGTTYKLDSVALHYLKIPKTREMWDFDIDLKKTAQQETRPLENVIGSLNYERDVRTLIPFSYGQVATKHIKVMDMPSSEEYPKDKIYEGEREGIVSLRCIELI